MQLEVLDQTMKTTFRTSRLAALAAGLLISASAVHSQDNSKIPSRDMKETKTMTGYVGPIEKQTMENEYFRQVLFTGPHWQLVVICLQPGEAIGDEAHPHVGQFFRIEKGQAKFVLNEKEEHMAHAGDAVVVPAGTYHNVINTSKTLELKLYTIYSPPNHPDGTVHKTKADAEAADALEHK